MKTHTHLVVCVIQMSYELQAEWGFIKLIKECTPRRLLWHFYVFAFFSLRLFIWDRLQREATDAPLSLHGSLVLLVVVWRVMSR